MVELEKKKSITTRAPPRGYPGTRSFILGIVPLIFSNASVFNTAIFNLTIFNTTIFNAIVTVFNQVL